MRVVTDAHSRRIVGWRVAANMRTQMMLDALEMARWARGARLEGLVARTDADSGFTSVRDGERLEGIGAVPSIGSVGDSYANALAEADCSLYKTELIRGPGKTPGARSTTSSSPLSAGSTDVDMRVIHHRARECCDDEVATLTRRAPLTSTNTKHAPNSGLTGRRGEVSLDTADRLSVSAGQRLLALPP